MFFKKKILFEKTLYKQNKNSDEKSSEFLFCVGAFLSSRVSGCERRLTADTASNKLSAAVEGCRAKAR